MFVYLNWRKLREDYQEQDLVTFGWLAILLYLVFGRTAWGLSHWSGGEWGNWWLVASKPGLSLLGGYGGLVAASLIICQIKDWKIWAFIEDVSFNLWLFLSLMIFSEGEWGWLGIMAIVGGAMLWFKNKYRSWIWYKSGRKGFVFWASNIVFWLLAAVYLSWSRTPVLVVVSYIFLALISVAGLFIIGAVRLKK